MNVDRRIAIKSGLVMVAVLAPIFIALAIALPKSFFEDWGWLAGPSVWMACAYVVARVCALPVGRVLVAAVVAGIPQLGFVLVGLHDVGPVVSLPLFALLCARTPPAASRPG